MTATVPVRSEEPIQRRSAFVGMGLVRFQLILLGVALALSLLFFLLGNPVSLKANLISTFIIGNLTGLSLDLAEPFYSRPRGGLEWVAYLLILIPVATVSSLIASGALLLAHVYQGSHRSVWLWSNLGSGVLVSLLTGIPIYAVARTRERLEQRNLLLQKEIEVGAVKLNAQEADLRTAHDIQAHLLPAELPTIPGMQLAFAWQPAQSVGGDYFDAIALGGERTALCIADVSGKGISAALLMANMQAAFRAFAPQAAGPAELCTRLNQALCGNIAAAKFVTFFCAILDSGGRILHYENAGHNPPILLRDGEAIPLTGGGLVLGLIADTPYEDRSLQLRSGDCLLLTTDGVTEAASASGEEFGDQRTVEAARSALQAGAFAVRSRILEAVTQFCDGDFLDDATLMVLIVD